MKQISSINLWLVHTCACIGSIAPTTLPKGSLKEAVLSV